MCFERLAARRKGSARPLVAVVIAVVLVVGVVVFNLVGIFNIPFLPQSPEIVLVRALENVTHDGEFNVNASAKTNAGLELDVSGQKATSAVDITATAAGQARDFDANDLLKLRIDGGDFAADVALALESPLISGASGNVHAAGTFELIVGDGALNYALAQPFSHEGTISFNPNEILDAGRGGSDGSGIPGQSGMTLRNVGDAGSDAASFASQSRGSSSGGVSLGLRDIKGIAKEGNVITFTVSTEPLSFEDVSRRLCEGFESLGITTEDARVSMSDLDVRVDLSDANTVRAHVTGQVHVTAQGRTGELLFGLLDPLPADLTLSAPLDVDLMLS